MNQLTRRALCAAAPLALVSALAAQTVTLTPTQDATIFDEGAFASGAGESIFVGVTDTGEIRRGLMRFDIAGNLPADALILSATLELQISSPNAVFTSLRVNRVTSDWSEGSSDGSNVWPGAGDPAMAGDVTWTDSSFGLSTWSTPGGEFDATTVGARSIIPGALEIDLYYADVQDMLDNPADDFGLILRTVQGSEGPLSGAKQIASRENADVSLRPKLVIEYTTLAANPTFCNVTDGALALCPCANPGLPHTGCELANPTGGVFLGLLEQDFVAGTALIRAVGKTRNSAGPSLLVRSSTLESTPAVFGDGLRCVGATGFTRLSSGVFSHGIATYPVPHGAGPGTFHYQSWVRNAPSAPCDPSAAYTMSSGISLTW